MADIKNKSQDSQNLPKFEQLEFVLPKDEQQVKSIGYSALNGKFRALDKKLQEYCLKVDKLNYEFEIIRKSLRR